MQSLFHISPFEGAVTIEIITFIVNEHLKINVSSELKPALLSELL